MKGNIMKNRHIVATTFILFVACIALANWALETWGIVGIGFGLMAPAGVYFAGATFGVRDALHDAGGRLPVMVAILVGGAVSLWTAPGFAVASTAAFLISETADLAVYDPLRRSNWPIAVVLSNLVGALVDSLIFLTLAFGWAAAQAGWFDLTIGKAYLVAPSVLLVGAIRRAVSRNA